MVRGGKRMVFLLGMFNGSGLDLPTCSLGGHGPRPGYSSFNLIQLPLKKSRQMSELSCSEKDFSHNYLLVSRR